MKNLLLFFAILISQISHNQTLIYNQNFESSGSNWNGYPTINTYSTTVNGNTNITTDRPLNANKYSSTSNGFSQFGSGTGTSSVESEIYELPNITGLDIENTYILSLDLMAYAQNYGSLIGSGLDATDYVDVRISTDGGLTYVTESRITGFDNSYWSFNSNGVINETANNSMNTYSPTVGGNQETTGKGYSKYNLTLTNISQLSVRIFMRNNYGGVGYGEWWIIDNLELFLIEPVVLPVELTYFEGLKQDNVNILKWQTSSEYNSDYFVIERTNDGNFTNSIKIGFVLSSGYSQELVNYYILDMKPTKSINYYRLIQYDRDGKYKIYEPIMIDNRIKKEIIKILDLNGKEVNLTYKGIVIIYYDDGEIIKTYQY